MLTETNEYLEVWHGLRIEMNYERLLSLYNCNLNALSSLVFIALEETIFQIQKTLVVKQ